MVNKIEIDMDNIRPLINMLYLSNKSKVIKLANYIKRDSSDKKQAEFGNTCADYQNYIYETFGICLQNNLLSEKNKRDYNNFIDKCNRIHSKDKGD